MVLNGVMNLDFHAPGSLGSRWNAYRKQYKLADDVTTTVYHFGLSEDDRSVVAFAYRSASGFRSERVGHGFGIKPEYAVAEGTNLMEVIPRMMDAHRAIQNEVAPVERIYIGGEAIIMHLTASACTVHHAHEFPERASDQARMLKKHVER